MAYSKKQIETIFKEICRQMSEEGKSLRKVLLQEGMPESHTFYKWIDNDEAKLLQYVRACNKRADVIFEEIITIADTTQTGITKKITEKGGVEITEGDMIQHRRLQVDARKWVVSKMNPKKYGEASLLKIGNIDGSEFKINAIFPNDGLYVPTDDSLRKDKSTKKDD